jgi:hypothetical protein
VNGVQKEKTMIQNILEKLKNVKKNGSDKTFKALCPSHDDQKESLSITEASDKILLHCHAGCTVENICTALTIEPKDLFGNKKSIKKRIVETYDYQDENGNLLFQAVRFEPKEFRQRRFENGKGIWNLKDTRRVLYRLPELLKSDKSFPAFICEGEKDVENLRKLNLTATCNPMGAGKWKNEYSESLKGFDCVILPDNDEAGTNHAEQVAKSLLGTAEQVRILHLPDLQPKGDVSEWIAKGNNAEDLKALIDGAEIVTSETFSENEDEIDENAIVGNQANKLIEIGKTAELWHTSKGETFASFVNHNEQFETCEIRSENFDLWLNYTFWQAERKSPNEKAFKQSKAILTSLALFEGETKEIFTRLAHHETKYFLDLCDKEGQVIEISSEGWKVLSAKDVPVRFRRASGMLPLPVPVAGGEVRELRQFVNLQSEEDFLLLLAWLVSSLRGDAPKYSVLSITGEQGSAKSTLSLILRQLIDPNEAPLRFAVRSDWDLCISATNSWIICFNNLSDLPSWLSDALCCLVEGGGFAVRTHHEMTKETIFQAKRPIILNGIADVTTRPDLLDRAVCLHLPTILDSERKNEIDFFNEFYEARPRILGALLNGVCSAIRNLPDVKLERRPRMADFAAFGVASEKAFGFADGAFMKAYEGNREAGNAVAIENSPLAGTIITLMKTRKFCDGRTSEVLTLLRSVADEETRFLRSFPKQPNQLTSQLKRISANLRLIGIDVKTGRNREGGFVTFQKL